MRLAIGAVVARGSRSTVHRYGRGAVVKVPHADTPAGWVAYEARYTKAVRAAGAPVPRLLAIEDLDGRPVSVWEHVDGPSLWQRIVDRPAQAEAAGTALAALHRRLMALPAPVALPRQADRLRAKVRLAAGAVDPGLTAVLDLVPQRPGPACLCHGDLHPSNVLLSAEGPVVVDWFDASCGDAVVDVARSELLLHGAPAHLPGADPDVLAGVRGGYLAALDDLPGLAERLPALRAVNAAARIAEGVPPAGLLAIVCAYGATSGRSAS